MPASAPEGRYYERLEGGSVRCGLCPHRCVLKDGAVGLCRVRVNHGGRLELPFFGAVSAEAIDPIEKKPLYHFKPGSRVYSVGYLGCNLRCPFCQNYGISQTTLAPSVAYTPAGLARAAKASGCPSLAHTYSEPLVHAEFVIETMVEARAAGLANVLVTNGCALADAASDVLDHCDAANVDLKSWDTAWYRSELGGDLDAVKAFIAMAIEKGVHVEVTTLVIPGKTDKPEDIVAMSKFLAGLSPDIPYHLSAYRPVYKYTIPPTPDATVQKLASLAREQLRYVYEGNIFNESNDTRCPYCGAILVRRHGYAVDASGLKHGACAACGTPAPFVA